MKFFSHFFETQYLILSDIFQVKFFAICIIACLLRYIALYWQQKHAEQNGDALIYYYKLNAKKNQVFRL